MPPFLARVVPLVAALLALTVAPPASADPSTLLSRNALDDLLADGDLDGEDLTALRLGSMTPSTDLHGSTWVSLIGYGEQAVGGGSGFGAGLVVGVAFDRIAAGPAHVLSDPARIPLAPAPPAPPPAPAVSPTAAPAPDPVSPRFARDCVAAALRASGLGVDDRRLDDIVARARASAWLPETRLRAERVWNDSADVSVYTVNDPADFYDAVGANFTLELRLTWRLDRLLYAGDEPMIERVRLQRQFERTRLATQVLEVLFAWRRAELAATEAPPSSRERSEAEGKVAEAHATLDVLTAGWFSERPDVRGAPAAGTLP